MNAAFLLLTTAALAGADAAPANGHAVAAPAGSCCNGGCGAAGCCDSCCDSCGKPGLFDRLRARFAKNDCCDSCTTCAPVHYYAAPTCGGCCDTGCGKGGGLFDRFRCRKADDCCQPSCCQPVCGATCGATCGASCCDDCGKPGLFARLRARFAKNDCCAPSCCDSGCANGACGNGHAAPAPAPADGEKIDEPKDAGGAKEMPKGDKGKPAPKKEEKKKVGRLNLIEPPAVDVTPAASRDDEGTGNPF